jgi:TetR/AcrR family transcriptional repressor of nem operon
MRTKDPDPPTRTRLLDAAEELMLAKGYVAATLDEICVSAGVTKGSFFHYFRSKEELGKVLLERFSRQQEAAFVEACASIEDPLERVYCLIDCAIESSRRADTKGCLVGTFAQEIAETHPQLRQVCEHSFERFAAGVSRDLTAAKDRHAPTASFDTESLGHCFLALAQGSMLLLKATGDRAAMGKNLYHLKNYIKTLYGR